MAQITLFLAGSDRSGIGLLADILDRHPEIAISRRINFWTFYAGRFGPLDNGSNLDRCLEDMWRFRRVTDLGIDSETVRNRFIDGDDHSYAGLFAVIGATYAQARRKAVWGDKSLNSERHVDEIFSSFAGARMIHVLRDPRDRHVSVMTHRGGKRAGVFGTTAVWVDSEHRATRNAASYGARYLVLRYEDLCHDPVAVLKSACDLAEVSFEESLLEDPSKGMFLHSRSIGRFEDESSAVDVATIQGLSREGMRRRGYRFEQPSLSPLGRFRVAVRVHSIGLLLIRVWRPWSGIKSRFSRGPSSRRLAPSRPRGRGVG